MARVWYAKDADFLEDPAIVELGDRHGPGGPLVIDALLGLAKLAREGGRVTVGHTALARRAFIDGADTVRAILRDSAEFGVLEVDEISPLKCEVRFPQWDRWQTAHRKARQRERDAGSDRDSTVTDRDSTVPPLSREPLTEDKGQNNKGANAPVEADASTVRELFSLWQERCSHENAKFTDGRRRKITARLRDGYTPDDIRVAIEGAANAPFVKDGKRFDDIELVCRNGEKLELFMERGQSAVEDTPAALAARMRDRQAA